MVNVGGLRDGARRDEEKDVGLVIVFALPLLLLDDDGLRRGESGVDRAVAGPVGSRSLIGVVMGVPVWPRGVLVLSSHHSVIAVRCRWPSARA